MEINEELPEQRTIYLCVDEDGKKKEVSLETDDDGFINISDVSIGLLGQQGQYVSRYVDGILEGYPKLGQGLRVEGDSENYYSMKIHKDDVIKFVDKYKDYRKMK